MKRWWAWKLRLIPVTEEVEHNEVLNVGIGFQKELEGGKGLNVGVGAKPSCDLGAL